MYCALACTSKFGDGKVRKRTVCRAKVSDDDMTLNHYASDGMPSQKGSSESAQLQSPIVCSEEDPFDKLFSSCAQHEAGALSNASYA